MARGVRPRPTSVTPVERERRFRRGLASLATALGILGVAATAWYHTGLVINHTGSLPPGLYRVERLSAEERAAAAAGRLVPPPGAVVVWCLPAEVGAFGRRRGYLLRGPCPGGVEPVLKHVAAIAGDTVVVGAAGLAVHGRVLAHSRALERDALGRPARAVAAGVHAVRPGTAWLWSPYSIHSYDSRYYGGVPIAGWVGTARPIWVAGSTAP